MICPACAAANEDEFRFCVACGAALPGAMPVPESLSREGADPFAHLFPVGPAYAGFWPRFAAFTIDGILLSFADVVPWFLVLLMAGPANYFALAGAVIVFRVLASWLYEALMLSSGSQATLGKLALGIVVADAGGRRLSFARASGRHFAKYISSAALMIGYWIQPFTAKKQALHDIVAGTVVLRK